MGGAATPPGRGSTLGTPRLPELNPPMGCSLVTWKLNSYFYAPQRPDFTRLRGPSEPNKNIRRQDLRSCMETQRQSLTICPRFPLVKGMNEPRLGESGCACLIRFSGTRERKGVEQLWIIFFGMRYLNEAMARAWCESPWRTRFAKRPRGSQSPTRECTVPLEIAPSVVMMAPHMKSFSF